ncbi:hypothetical protein CIB48_g6475 [Xylaria polymorpha]|nr:hypothetical protein CIB48_g6475 [Xylaria polymorpha]
MALAWDEQAIFLLPYPGRTYLQSAVIFAPSLELEPKSGQGLFRVVPELVAVVLWNAMYGPYSLEPASSARLQYAGIRLAGFVQHRIASMSKALSKAIIIRPRLVD